MTTTKNQLPVNLQPEGYICVPLFVPNDSEWLWLVVKLLGHAAQLRYWKKQGGDEIEFIKEWESRVVTPFTERITAMELCEDGSMSCEDIADCIETDEIVQVAITNQLSTNINNVLTIARQNATQNNNVLGYEADTTTIGDTLQDDFDESIIDMADCDLDALWSACREIAQRLDDNARQFLEVLVTRADVGERAVSLIGAVPLIGDVLETTFNQLVEVIPDLKNLFEAYSSIETIDEAACDLFGIVCHECRYPTYTELYLVYAAMGATGVDDLAGLTMDVMADLLLGTEELAARICYGTMICFQLFTLYLGGKFNNLSTKDSIARLARLGADSPSPDWLVLCETCDEQYVIEDWDFRTQGQGNWILDTINEKGTFVSGEGWKGTVDGASKHARITRNISPEWVAVGIGFLTEYTGSPTASNNGWTWRLTRNSNTGAVNASLGTCTTGTFNRGNDTNTAQGYSQILISTLCSPQATTECYIRAVRVIWRKDFSPNGELAISREFCA